MVVYSSRGESMILHKNRFDYKIIISIIVSMAIILTSALYIYNINFSKTNSSYKATNGILNLQSWEKIRNVYLDGEWEFYPGVLLDPSDGVNIFENYSQIRKYVEVPGSWESYIDNNGEADGSGTYRLIIKLPKDERYGIKTRTIRSSSRIYLNGEEVANMGNPSLDRNNFKPASKYKIGFGKSNNQELEIVIHVSSYEYRSGGIIRSIEFGTQESILRRDQMDRGIDGLIISVCLVLSIYFFLTYLQRGKDLYLAYFSGTSFFMGLYLSTMNEQLLDLVLSYDFITRTRIQILCMIMVTVCFLKFTYYFFKEYRNKKVMNIITGIMLLNLLCIFNNPESSPSIPFVMVQILIIIGMLISYCYIFYILLKAIYNKSDSLGYILVIASSVASYWISLILKTLLELDLGYLPVILIFVIMVGVALLMSYKLQLDYQEVKNLSKRLIDYDQLKDEFLARASHELRTPLHVILNLTKSLIEGKKGTLNPRQQEDLFFINKEGKRLTRLVEDLLDASQINKGETKLRLGPIQVYKIVDDILREMRLLIPENKKLVLINKIPETFPALKADPDKFTQIIYNLVNNAIKFTESGEVIVSAYTDNGQAIIQVTDTGIGIEEKHMEEIFDIFYQNNQVDDGNEGLGLGLSIVKHLVESQGGKVHVESVYGTGSSFKVTLPLYEDELDEVESVETINDDYPIKSYGVKYSLEKEMPNYIDSHTVLIVDDELSNRRVMADIISDMGLNIIFAENGKDAIITVEKNKVDLIVLDFMLPDMSGDQVCKEIRQKYSIAELPILVLTASGRNIDLLNAFENGANDFLKKPADAEELRSRIQSLILMKSSVEEGLKKEFQYFYSQISPHFLYNTLNTIIGLSYKDSEKTRKALNNLSIYFRGKLDLHRGKDFIPLESELELVTAYLEIEQLRYGDRLKIEYDIEEDLMAMIPPLTLQPLVENSIRHGLATKKGGGWLKISARSHLDSVCITIEDNGVGMCTEKQQELLNGNSKRVGFTNVAEKIKILKGASLELDSKEGEGTKITIIIPEVKSYESHLS